MERKEDLVRNTARCSLVLVAVAVALMALTASAQAPPGRGQQGRGGRGAGGFTSEPENPAALLFREEWTRQPMAQPMEQAKIGNQNLAVDMYGKGKEI